MRVAQRAGSTQQLVAHSAHAPSLERMRAGGFNLGGEQSGHIVMTDYATTGDGLVAALQIAPAELPAGTIGVVRAHPLFLQLTHVKRTITRHASLCGCAVAGGRARLVAFPKCADERRCAIAIENTPFC